MKRVITLFFLIIGGIGILSLNGAQRQTIVIEQSIHSQLKSQNLEKKGWKKFKREFKAQVKKNESAAFLAKKAKRIGIWSNVFFLIPFIAFLLGRQAIELGQSALRRMETHSDEYSQSTIEDAQKAIKLGKDATKLGVVGSVILGIIGLIGVLVALTFFSMMLGL